MDIPMKTYKVSTIEDTANLAKDWLDHAIGDLGTGGGNSNSAYVVGLSGHLGAGKTAFVKCVAKELGIKEEITSPTFVIMKAYDIDPVGVAKRFGRDFPWKRLVHIDAYRLEKREELGAILFEQVVSDSGNLVMIEWPEQVGLEKEYPIIKFSLDDKGEGREIGF